MNSATTTQIPRIVFSGLDLSTPGSNGWDSVRDQVMDAVLDHGYFEAVFDRAFIPLQREELYRPILEELFNLPFETKMKTWNGKISESYIKHDQYEIVIIPDPANTFEAFTHLMWPRGNPSFSKTTEVTSKPLLELELMVRKMIFEGFGIDKYYDAHVKSTTQTIRFARYEPPVDEKSMISMTAHTDMNIISIVYQHDGEGLEVQTPEGQWLHAPQKTFTVLVGETLKALTNGRLKPTIHRVMKSNNDIRYSVSLGSHVSDGIKIEAPEEMVDDEHPKLYKPYEFEPYIRYRLTESGYQTEDVLKEFCGV